MEKEGFKLETHQNWIKTSKKTQIKAKRIRIRDRWCGRWWCFVEEEMGLCRKMISWEKKVTMISFLAFLFKSWRFKVEEDWDSKMMREKKIKGEGLGVMVVGGFKEGKRVIFLLSSCLYIVWNLWLGVWLVKAGHGLGLGSNGLDLIKWIENSLLQL